MRRLFNALLTLVWMQAMAGAQTCSTCGRPNLGNSSGIDVGPNLNVSLGGAQYGQSAGHLGFSASMPSFVYFSPASLQFSAGSRPDLTVISNTVLFVFPAPTITNTAVQLSTNITYTTNGSIVTTNTDYSQSIVTTTNSSFIDSVPAIRQIIAPQAVADIPAPPTSSGFVINLYNPTNVVGTNMDGTRTFAGSPFITWMVTNPVPTTTNELQISEYNILYGGTKQWTYNYTGPAQWSVTTLGGIVENMGVTNQTSSNYTLFDALQNYSGGPVVQQSANVYTTYKWHYCTNIAISQSTLGAGETTTYTYWEPSNFVGAASFVLLQSVVHADGSWEYYANYDTNGNPLQVFSSFGNIPMGSRTTARETDYTINPTNAGVNSAGDNGTINPKTPRLVVQKINGTEIARSYTTFPSLALRLDIQCLITNLPWFSIGNLVTTNRFYTNGPYQGMLQSVVRPDGTMTAYSYATNSTGFYQTNTMVTGQPDSGYSYVVDGTADLTVLNVFGFTVSHVVSDVLSGLVVSQDTYGGFDNFGRPTQVMHLDGTMEYTSFACCGVASTTDRDGVVDNYNYDTDGRLIGHTINYNTGSFVTYSNALDAAGRTVQAVRFGSDGSPVILSQSGYDTAGELTSQTNALGGVTLYTRSTNSMTGGLIRTTTNPDNGTITNYYYADGSLEETLGSAIAGKACSYGTGIDAGGVQCTTSTITNLTASGALSSNWTETFVDMAGRTTETLYASSTGAPHSYSAYGAGDQLGSQTDADGVITRYYYNLKGETVTNILKQHTGILPIVSWTVDRITFMTNYLTNSHSTTVLRSDTYVYDNNTQNSNIFSRVETSADGLRQWNTIWNSGTAVTSSSQTVYAGSGSRTVTNIAPDNSYIVSAYSYGRLASTTKYDSMANQIGGTTYGYDAHGRQNTITDARNGTTTLTFNPADQVSTVTTPSPAEVTQNYYDTSERLVGQKLPDGTYTTNFPNPNGTISLAYGSREYPIGNGYDSQMRVTTMTNWTSFKTLASPRVTTWNYDPYRGRLSSKVYADGNGTTYGYTPGGRLGSRLWARGTNTTYSNNIAGQLLSATYNDGLTPSLGYGYDRLGHQNLITNGSTLTTLVYNDPGLLLLETNSGGPLSGWSVTNGYDSIMRRTKMVVLSNSTPIWTVNYTYDNASRLATVSDGTNTATYSYLANSSLVGEVIMKHSGTTEMTTTKGYDNLNRLTGITNANGSSVVLDSHAYACNLANQRTSMTNADGSYLAYGYDSLGQVTSAVKYWSDGKAAAGEQFGNQFDDIGNRITSQMGGDENGFGLRTANYTANTLNQYTSRTVPGAVNIIGSATNTATVTVNGALAYRHGTYYRDQLPINNAGSAVWQSVTNLGILGGATNTNATVTGSVFLPQNPENFTYDKDGNLTSDGRFTNYWDAENRLIGVTNIANIATTGKVALSFAYDYMGRRIQKIVYTNSSGTWAPSYTNKFIYDGWNVVAILDGFNNLISSFAWGADLSGSMQGGGGIGGLISMTVYNGASAGTYFYAYDGNENVSVLVNSTSGALAAQYEYGPFGEVIRATGPMAFVNPFRFSTKFCDDETGLLYYGYRYYNPSTGRWLSRDPIEEDGGQNLYGFGANDPIINIDIEGMMVGKVSIPWWGAEKEDHLLWHRRGWHFAATWTPPTDGDWAQPCACKPCQKVIWIQLAKFGKAGTFHLEVNDSNYEKAGSAWDCTHGSSAAETDDSPDQHGMFVWSFRSPYSFDAITSAKCVAGRDAGKIYAVVLWGFNWKYDGTPTGSGPLIK